MGREVGLEQDDCGVTTGMGAMKPPAAQRKNVPELWRRGQLV